MTKIWLELKYGNPDKGGTLLSRIWSKYLLRQVKAEVLEDLDDRAMFSELKDEILGIIARADYEKHKKLLEKLIPETTDEDQ